MKQKFGPDKAPAEQVCSRTSGARHADSIRRKRRSALCWKACVARSISELCRLEGIAASMYYGWLKEFLEAGKRRLAGVPRPPAR